MSSIERHSKRKDKTKPVARSISLHRGYRSPEGDLVLTFVDLNNHARLYHLVLDDEDQQNVKPYFDDDFPQ